MSDNRIDYDAVLDGIRGEAIERAAGLIERGIEPEPPGREGGIYGLYDILVYREWCNAKALASNLIRRLMEQH